MRMQHLITTTLTLVITCCGNAQDLSRYPIVPWPQYLQAQDGQFELTTETRVTLSDPASPELRAIADFWAERVRRGSNFPMTVADGASNAASAGAVTFVLDPAAETGEEGYRLVVTHESVLLTASTTAGLFYGMQTLRQLLPVAVERGGVVRGEDTTVWAIPAVKIKDSPRFVYRGMHLDVGRHFMPTSFVKKYLDLMALYKFNRFHWHLTEDQGWRIEIKKYPKLAEVAAYRDETLIGHYDNQPHRFDGTRYGGYYTQEEIREIVAYAQERYITVIPEIELPGHSVAALAAYPELACTDGPFKVETLWGVHEDIYCPKEETFSFLEDVLTEVMDLFPGEYIHIGGDEAPKTRWNESSVAQEVIRREGLKDEFELQSYFIRRIERFLNAHGRRLIGWDEIVEGGLSPTATMMFWRTWNEEALHQAAGQGNDIIMTPTEYLYFDYYQAPAATEPLAIGGMITLQKAYSYEPVPASYTAEQAKHVLGAQGNVWTEYMKTPAKVEYMVFPRLLALSEVVWSPKAKRNWFAFKGRLPAQEQRLTVLGVNFRHFDF